MFRDVTFTDVSRADTIDDAAAGLVMDEDAFRAFYDRTARGVWAYLARITGDRQVADDLLQETFYRFLRTARSHESEAHRRNYLYRIATNVARDARRRNLVRAPFSLPSSDSILLRSARRSLRSSGATALQAARKPDSVLDDHSSRRRVTTPLQQPTRGFRLIRSSDSALAS